MTIAGNAIPIMTFMFKDLVVPIYSESFLQSTWVIIGGCQSWRHSLRIKSSPLIDILLPLTYLTNNLQEFVLII